MEPQGFSGSLPKKLVPFLPAIKPGAARLNVRSTMAFLDVVDLTLYSVPSSDNSNEQLSA